MKERDHICGGGGGDLVAAEDRESDREGAQRRRGEGQRARGHERNWERELLLSAHSKNPKFNFIVLTYNPTGCPWA